MRFFFFFSSRRRHTRFKCDWSSDVCSSDLGMVLGLVKMALQPLVLLFRSLHAFTSQADPREVEAQGHTLEEAGKEMGGALGGLAGAAAAGMGHGENHEETPPATEGEPLPTAAEPVTAA